MLADFVKSNRSLIISLGRNWLQAGAAHFSIWADGKLLDSWPQHPASAETVNAEIRVNGRVIGEVKLAGKNEATIASRLQMDADFLSILVARESDMNAMTSELLDTRDQLIALYNLTQKKWTSLDLDSTLEHLAEATANLTRSEAAFVAIQLEQKPFQFATSPADALDWSSVTNHVEALKEKRSQYLIVEDVFVPFGSPSPQTVLLNFQVRGADTAVIGIRTCVSQSALSPVIKLLQTIAGYTGSRIENLLMVQESVELARLHAEMELARHVQSNLLPETTPIVPGINIWAVSRPASFVGGDFYDIVSVANRPLTFTVGDISGKGFPASIPMAMARILIRYHINEFPNASTKAILSSMNLQLYEDFNRLGIFATLFICQYNPQMGSLAYSNAGHSPVIYCPSQRSPYLIQADGIPIGLMTDSTYEDNSLLFEEGDVLVIGTDAFYEAFNKQEQAYSLERLMELVKSLAHLQPDAIGEALLAAIENFQGDKAQDDDQTLIIIKCCQSKAKS
jgi:phosphoserine phosphatase RsbU/P